MSAQTTMRNTTVRTLLLIWAFTVTQATEEKDAAKAPAFSCRGRTPGYYADLETSCQDYHMCDAGGRRYTYSCPNQTRFQQRVMICDHWFMVNCSLSETHFGANLLIGQKNRQFVEHFQQASGQNEERSYPARNRAFYAGPTSSSKDDQTNQSKTDNHVQPQGVYANEIKQALFTKSPPLQSPTKKSPEEKNSSVKTPDTNRYYSQFSTPTGSIKATTERGLPREFANNPFFRGLTRDPSSSADKGGQDSLTFLRPHLGKDQAVSSGDAASTSWTPTPSRRTTSSYLKPSTREATPNLRHTPSFPNYQERRTSTLVTTKVPLTYDYNSVTPEGRSNHLTQTETPKLRNNFSKVIPNNEDFTSESSPTTQYEFLKTRGRTDARAPDPHASGDTPSPRADKSAVLNVTQGSSPQPTAYGSGQYRPDVTQGYRGVQRTPGGFRFSADDATPLVPDRRPTSHSVLVPTAADTAFRGSGTVPTGPDSKFPVSGEAPTAADTKFYSSGGVPTGPSAKFPVSGGSPTAADTKFSSSGLGFTGPGPLFPVSGGSRYAPNATPQVSGGDSTGLGFTSLHSGDSLYTDVKFSSSGGASPTSLDGLGVDPLSSHIDDDEHGLDFNTVEVRIPDPRRMFFIPDNAAREAEMLSSNNETVFKISLPSARHHGAMRFKGVRGTEGRRADCPQCHPAFLLPGKCQPCVLIRR